MVTRQRRFWTPSAPIANAGAGHAFTWPVGTPQNGTIWLLERAALGGGGFASPANSLAAGALPQFFQVNITRNTDGQSYTLAETEGFILSPSLPFDPPVPVTPDDQLSVRAFLRNDTGNPQSLITAWYLQMLEATVDDSFAEVLIPANKQLVTQV